MQNRFTQLLEMAEKLRSETGCPWDREQSIATMKRCVLEEAQEVADAIDKNDLEELSEELGDLLFNIVLITQIASEAGHFDMDTVLAKIEEKIRSRHTWVFGKDTAETPEEAVALWMKNKAKEREAKALPE